MTTIHLVRHGQTDWNVEGRVQGQTESRLTPLGEQQARDIAEQLQQVKFDRAFTSSSRRARDTAEFILQHHDLELEARDELREIHLGEWEGRLHADIARSHPESHSHYWRDPSRFALEGAETFLDIQTRAVSAFNEIVSENEGKTILIVSHGVFIKALLSHYEGRHLRDIWLPPKMTNCCHSIIERSPAGEFVICQYAG